MIREIRDGLDEIAHVAYSGVRAACLDMAEGEDVEAFMIVWGGRGNRVP